MFHVPQVQAFLTHRTEVLIVVLLTLSLQHVDSFIFVVWSSCSMEVNFLRSIVLVPPSASGQGQLAVCIHL